MAGLGKDKGAGTADPATRLKKIEFKRYSWVEGEGEHARETREARAAREGGCCNTTWRVTVTQ